MKSGPISENLLRQLINAREDAGLTQSQLADLLDVQPSTVNAIERGRKNTTVQLLERWAHHCDAHVSIVRPTSLVDLGHLPRYEAQIIRRLITTLPRLSPDATSGVLGMIAGLASVVSAPAGAEDVTKRHG